MILRFKSKMLKKVLFLTILLCFVGRPVLTAISSVFDVDLNLAEMCIEDESEEDSELDGEDTDDKEVDKEFFMLSDHAYISALGQNSQLSVCGFDTREMFLGVIDPPPEVI